MSKSIGNVLLLQDLLAAHPGEVVRLGLLNAHYRQPLDWTDQLLTDARRRLDRMYAALRDAGIAGRGSEPADEQIPPRVQAALEDDLNTPEALAEMADIVRATNRETDPVRRLELAATLRAGGWLLGLLQTDPAAWFSGDVQDASQIDEAAIDALLKERERLRAARNFAAADGIRDELLRQGILIEDGAEGTRWRRA
jgi:cysteinyl-tRNA synthetase